MSRYKVIHPKDKSSGYWHFDKTLLPEFTMFTAYDKNKNLRKAGASRWRGIRPTVRGVAMHPDAHPHGGGEGRSGVGLKYPKTPWGKKAVGKTRSPRKYSDSLIVEGRKRGVRGLTK